MPGKPPGEHPARRQDADGAALEAKLQRREIVEPARRRGCPGEARRDAAHRPREPAREVDDVGAVLEQRAGGAWGRGRPSSFSGAPAAVELRVGSYSSISTARRSGGIGDSRRSSRRARGPTGVPATVGYCRSGSAPRCRRSARSRLRPDRRAVADRGCTSTNPQFHPLRGAPLNWKGDPGPTAAAGALFEYGFPRRRPRGLARGAGGAASRVPRPDPRRRAARRSRDAAGFASESGAVASLSRGGCSPAAFPGIPRAAVRNRSSRARRCSTAAARATGASAHDGSVREEVELEPLGRAVLGLRAPALRRVSGGRSGCPPRSPTGADAACARGGARRDRVLGPRSLTFWLARR